MWSFLQSTYYFFMSVLWPVGQGMGQGLLTVGRWLRWAGHILILLVILVVLYFLNSYLQIDRLIPRPVFAQTIWLPIFFLLLYALGWIGWWLWKLLSAEGESSHFPDIDEAWDEAVRTLGQAGIRLGDVPLFFVLGRPEAAEEHIFGAAQLNLVVKQSPPGAGAPIHVYASRDAVYVTAPGASLLGRHAVLMALEEFPDQDEFSPGGDNFDPSKSMGATLRPGEKEKEIKMVLRRGAGPVAARDRRAMRREAGLKLPDLAPGEWDLLTARLAHFARLIVRDRYPLCPINGIMVLIPVGGSDTESDAQRTAEICYRDLATMRRALKVLCPVYGMVCDLETLPGFPEFLQAQEQKDRLRRLGQRFPFVPPDLGGDDYFDKIRQSVEFMSTSLLREWVYRLFRIENPGREEKQVAVNRNNRLFLMLEEMRGRGKWLGRILANGVARDAAGLFGGCYLAGTGANKERDQGFVAGVFRRLVESQNFVSWTDQAQADDVKNHRLATAGYVVLGVAAVALSALAAYRWFFGRRR